MADHTGRSRRLASSVQHHPLRAVACDWPALLVGLAAPCMSRIPRGANGEDHDYRLHHSGFDHYRCHLSHAPAQLRRLCLGQRRPLASSQAACIGSAAALIASLSLSAAQRQRDHRACVPTAPIKSRRAENWEHATFATKFSPASQKPSFHPTWPQVEALPLAHFAN